MYTASNNIWKSIRGKQFGMNLLFRIDSHTVRLKVRKGTKLVSLISKARLLSYSVQAFLAIGTVVAVPGKHNVDMSSATVLLI